MSNTHCEWFWFNSADTTQTSEQVFCDLTTSYRRPYSSNSPQRLDPVVCFLEVDKTCVDVVGILPRFIENFLDIYNLVCSATARTKNALGIIQLWFNYFAASFSKALGMHFSREAKEGYAPVVNAFSLVPFLCIGMINPVCQSFGARPGHQVAWYTRVSQRSPCRFKALSISGQMSSQSFPVFIVLTARTSVTVIA